MKAKLDELSRTMAYIARKTVSRQQTCGVKLRELSRTMVYIACKTVNRLATKMSSAQTENGNIQRSRTVEVVKASQPHFTLSLLTLLKAGERRGFLEDTGLEDKCSWVLFAAG